MFMKRSDWISLFRQSLAAAALAVSLPAAAQQVYTYDFVWYSGAQATWIYEAGAKVFVDVYEDTSTPENDVLFRVRNGIDTELGYESRIRDLQIDTGSLAPDMFDSVTLAEVSTGVRYFMYTPNVERTTLLDLSAGAIGWTGDYAAGVVPNSTTTDGINPNEYVVLRGVLKDGLQFSDVIQAMHTGLSTTYLEGHLGEWTSAQKDLYRAGASQGLRFVLLLQSIVPNWWNNLSHGLFVTHRLVAANDGGTPVITSVSATPSTLLDSETSQLAVVASDPDNGPQPLFYQWQVVSGGGTLDDPASANPVYTPENVTESRTVTLQVDVSDGATTVSHTITLQVDDASAPPPNAVPQIVTLTATPATLLDTQTSQLAVTASDADGGPQALSYRWSIVGGGGVLSDATSATPVYTPADGVGTQSVTLKVEVSDGAATVSGNLVLTVEDADPPPQGAQILVADFNNGSLAGWSVHDEGTVDGPSKWSVVSGELAQLSNIRDGSTSTSLVQLGTYLQYDDGLGWTDYRAKFRLRSVDDDALGLMFRVQDSNNYYRFSWNKQLNQRRLVKRVGGVFTLLAADNVPYVQNQNYAVEIVAQGGQLEVWIDGARVFQVSDASLAQGSVAFYTSQDKGAYFDDLSVNAIE